MHLLGIVVLIMPSYDGEICRLDTVCELICPSTRETRYCRGRRIGLGPGLRPSDFAPSSTPESFLIMSILAQAPVFLCIPSVGYPVGFPFGHLPCLPMLPFQACASTASLRLDGSTKDCVMGKSKCTSESLALHSSSLPIVKSTEVVPMHDADVSLG
jgi:hypothetical protein